jgi:hypothetical protein
MRLTDLDPQFRMFRSDKGLGKTDSLAEAQGITFCCPVCPSGHWLLIWFDHKNVPAEAEPVYRWQAQGNGYDDLTLAPSINAQINDPKCWHGYVRNGEIT